MSNYSNSTFYFSPSGYGENQIQAQNPSTSLGALTFGRASTATRTDINNNVREVPFNLISNGIASPSFYATQTNITSFNTNTTPQPIGISSGVYKLIPNATSGQHNAYGSVTLNNGIFTYSLYVQASGYNYVSLGIDTGLTGSSIIFSLTDGTFTGSESGFTPFISNVGNGWYRIGFTDFNLLQGAINVYVIVRNNATTANYSGDTTSGILLCAPQIAYDNLPQQYFSTGNRLNVPRIDYSQGIGALLLEPQRTNSIRNSTMQGASVAGNTTPTNWGNTSNGLTSTVVGLGVENGLNYIDVRYNGTANNTFVQLNFETLQIITASQGQSWTESFYVKLVNAPIPPNNYQLQINEFLNNTYLVSNSQSFSITSTLTRISYKATIQNASTNNIIPYWISAVTSGSSYDFTIRIAAPQLELGAYSTTYIATTNASATRLADSFIRDNIYTNNLISASGGTWFVQLINNLALSALSGELVGAGLGLRDLYVSPTNGFQFRQGGGTQRLNVWKIVGGVSSAMYDLLTDTAKIAIKWNGSTADVFVNGVKQVSATSFTATNMEFLTYLQGQRPTYISQMALYNTPLSDALCISITT